MSLTKAERKAKMFAFLKANLDPVKKMEKSLLRDLWNHFHPDLTDYFQPLMHNVIATGQYQCSKLFYYTKTAGKSNWYFKAKMKRNKKKQDKREIEKYKVRRFALNPFLSLRIFFI